MTRNEFQVLDYVAVRGCPVAWLFSRELGELTNKPALQISVEDRTRLLLSMHEAGLVIGDSLYEDVPPQPVTEQFIADAIHQMEAKPVDKFVVPEFFYRLTPKGGARWEGAAKPDWSRFCTYSSDLREKEIEAASMDVLNRTLKCDRYYSGEWPQEETVLIEEMTPWAATYWKTLPLGFRATYLFDPQEPARIHSPEAVEWFTQQNAWYKRPSWDEETKGGA